MEQERILDRVFHPERQTMRRPEKQWPTRGGPKARLLVGVPTESLISPLQLVA